MCTRVGVFVLSVIVVFSLFSGVAFLEEKHSGDDTVGMSNDRFRTGNSDYNNGGISFWAKTYGGTGTDYANDIQQTSDGGCIAIGETNSFGAGGSDCWILKLDSSGNVEWQKTYGGTGTEFVQSIRQTFDGGYIAAGETNSFSAASHDYWILKLDSSGSIQWQKTFGGAFNDYTSSIQQTFDGGYIVAGETFSYGTGGLDCWILKLDGSGNVEWQKTYGGTDADSAGSIQQTSEGGYIVAGYTDSFGSGGTDFWMLKLDSSGVIEWQKTYGGTINDYAYFTRQTLDGGYVVAGNANSFGAGVSDNWILKLDGSGNVQWQKTYGGTGTECANSIQQTSDGGYIVAGYTNSFGAGDYDTWIMKLDASGVVQWQKTYGGTGSDWSLSVMQDSDGGYISAGVTDSIGAGDNDAWILKLDTNGEISGACAIYGDTSVTGVNTSMTPSDTSITVSNSSVTAADTSVSGVNSNAVIMTQCEGCTGLFTPSQLSVDAQPCGGSITTDSKTPELAWGDVENEDGYEWEVWTGSDCTGTIADNGTTAINITWTGITNALSNGSYYWRVRALGDGVIYCDSGWVCGCPFTVDSCSDDTYEDNDTCVAASQIAVGETKTHLHCDADWIKFDAVQGTPYEIRTFNLIGGADTVIYLYRSDCSTLINLDDNGGGGPASLINWTADETGTFYVEITEAGDSYADGKGYDISVKCTLELDLWAKTYGGTYDDYARSFCQTSDAGYVVAGHTDSFGAGGYDCWILKLDGSGNVEWQKVFGGTDSDEAYSIQQTSDGGYIIAGTTASFGAGNYDYWILKLDSSGNILWQKTYGGTDADFAYFIQQTADGGYIAAGYTNSFGTGDYDCWMLKLDSSGNFEWQKTYGGGLGDYAYSIQQTTDEGYILLAQTFSFGTGSCDYWILKLDSSGNVQWQKTYGGTGDEYAFSIQQTFDEGYIIAGYTNSFGVGSGDYCILKLDSSGNVQWQKTYGGTTDECAFSIQQTSDEGYIVAGHADSFGAGNYDSWILKLDSSGNVQWQKTYGGTLFDSANFIQQTSEGEYIVSANTWSFGMGSYDFWILKLDANGEVSSECGIYADTSVTGANASVSASDTGISGSNSSVTPANTSVSGVNTGATVMTQCQKLQLLSVGEVPSGEGVGAGVLKNGNDVIISHSAADHATHYNLYRGTIASLQTGTYDHNSRVNSELCSGDDSGDLVLEDSGAVTDSGSYYYLIAGNNESCEGSYGKASNDMERPVSGANCGLELCP